LSLQHFYLEDQVIDRETQERFELLLSPDDIKHARVLRMGPGEHIAVVDADKDYFEVEVDRFDADGMIVHIARHLESASERPEVILLQGLAKGDKMDDRQTYEVQRRMGTGVIITKRFGTWTITA